MQYRSFASKAVGQLLVRAGPLRARKIFLRVFCRWVYCTIKFRHTMSMKKAVKAETSIDEGVLIVCLNLIVQ